jgi:cysteine-rich repeat protein
VSLCEEREKCGDGIIQKSKEICDDGNAVSDDGCSSNCTSYESGFLCQSKSDYNSDTYPEELRNYQFDTLCVVHSSAAALIALASVGTVAAVSAIQILRSATSLKMGADVFFIANTIQIARTTTLISPQQNRYIKNFLNQDFQFFNFELPIQIDLTNWIIENTGIELNVAESVF